jgi:hypothetical protein
VSLPIQNLLSAALMEDKWTAEVEWRAMRPKSVVTCSWRGSRAREAARGRRAERMVIGVIILIE